MKTMETIGARSSKGRRRRSEGQAVMEEQVKASLLPLRPQVLLGRVEQEEGGEGGGGGKVKVTALCIVSVGQARERCLEVRLFTTIDLANLSTKTTKLTKSNVS